MAKRFLALSLVAAAVALASCSKPGPSTSASNETAAAPAQPGVWKQPVTAWGDPDLQGMWPIINLISTPFQRPVDEQGNSIYGDRRVAHRRGVRQDEGAPRGARRGVRQRDQEQQDGYGPLGRGEPSQRRSAPDVAARRARERPLPGAHGARQGARVEDEQQLDAARSFDKPTDFDTWDRCITRGLPPSMFPFNYNNGIEIMQAPGYVVIRLEMIHESAHHSGRRPPAARSRDQAVDGRVARALGRRHARRRDDELQRRAA